MEDGVVINLAEVGGARREFPNQFGDDLKEIFKDSDIYRFRPQAGVIYGAAFDWTIISYIADLSGIASAIWLIYEKVIKRNRDDNKTTGIHVNIDSRQGLHWIIGKTIKDKDLFIKDFTVKVSNYKSVDGYGSFIVRRIEHIKASSILIKGEQENK